MHAMTYIEVDIRHHMAPLRMLYSATFTSVSNAKILEILSFQQFDLKTKVAFIIDLAKVRRRHIPCRRVNTCKENGTFSTAERMLCRVYIPPVTTEDKAELYNCIFSSGRSCFIRSLCMIYTAHIYHIVTDCVLIVSSTSCIVFRTSAGAINDQIR